MRLAALLMAALLALSLTACMDDGKNNDTNQTPGTTENENNNGGTNNGGMNNGNTNNDTNKEDNQTNNPDKDNDVGTVPDNNIKDEDDKPNGTSEVRRVMYNGNLYEVTNETLSADEVGVELFSITSIVTDTPAEDGDAVGLDEGTRVFRLKDDNQYEEIAVEINQVYYKAVKEA